MVSENLLADGAFGMSISSHQTRSRKNAASLHHQHAVAVRIKPVPLLDGVTVRGEGQFRSGECADEQQQAGPGQVKIRQHRPDPPELEARVDENIRLSARLTRALRALAR